MRAYIFVAVALVACGKSGGKPPPKLDDPAPADLAGRVIELSGDVTVERGQQLAMLAVGAGVTADDTIDTGAAGRIVIELAKNHARWELTSNHRQKVRDSIAWKLPDNAGNASVVIRDQAGVTPPPDPAGAKEIERALDPRKPDLIKCLGEFPKMTLVIDTGPGGLAGFKVKGGTRESADCMMRVLQTTQMPKLVAHAAVPVTKS